MRTLVTTLLVALASFATACTDPGSGPSGDDGGDDTPCVAKTCAELGMGCGAHSNGCGEQVNCGSCTTCTTTTCAAVGAQCGAISDGCTGTLMCGGCDAGDSCSFYNLCECAPQCAGQGGAGLGGAGLECGDNGCGGSCGTCGTNEICSASGTCDAHVSSTPPAAWVCNDAYWDALDGCDCNCGALDPDCSLTGQQLLGCTGLSSPTCGPGGTCTGGGTCNATPTGPYLTLYMVAQAAPAMTGGTILPGRYEATGVTRYTGVGGAYGNVGGDGSAIEISGSTWNRVTRRAGGYPNVDETFTAAISGNAVSLSRSCPSTATMPMTFTATPTSLKVAYQNSGTMVVTYTKKW